MSEDREPPEADADPERQAEILRRIAEIKERLMEIANGEAIFGQIEEMPPEMELEFLEHVLAVEEEPNTTCSKLLIEEGVALPPPEDLDDDPLHRKLWEVIRALAEMNTYLGFTDHLSDRELYTRLWTETLNEPTWDMRGKGSAACHIDMIVSGSDEDTRAWLAYYATDRERDRWREDFPEFLMPDRHEPPYDRDRSLPAPEYPPFGSGEDEEDDKQR